MIVNLDVAGVLSHIRHESRFALLGHPAGDAFADAQLEPRGAVRQPVRGLYLKQPVSGVDEHDRAGGGTDEANRLAHDQPKRLLLVEGRVDDLAYLIKPLKLDRLDGRVNVGVIAHRLANDGSSAAISQGYVVDTVASMV